MVSCGDLFYMHISHVHVGQMRWTEEVTGGKKQRKRDTYMEDDRAGTGTEIVTDRERGKRWDHDVVR